MARVTLPLAAYREMAAFVSTEQTRYYLNGVCIETPSGVAVATDGHMLAARRVDPAEFLAADAAGDWIVPVVPAVARAKAPAGFLRKLPLWLVIDRPDNERFAVTLHVVAAVTAADAAELPRAGIVAMAAAELVDGSFPEWRRVVPRGGERPGAEYVALREAVARWESEALPTERVSRVAHNRGLDAARDALAAVAWAPPVAPAFSAALLTRALQPFAAGGAGGAAPPVRVHPGVTAGDPALIQIVGRDDVVIVIMPMRAETGRYAAPDWSAPAAPQASGPAEPAVSRAASAAA